MKTKKLLYIGLSVLAAVSVILLLLPPAKPRPPKNVIFILLDALRADHLGCYGYKRNTSPFIDSLAGNGVLFENHFSQAGWTLPSVASYFTSLYPDFHKTVIFENKLNPRLMKISKIMKAAGYFTAGGSTNVGISEMSGFSDGFESWTEGFDDIRLTRWAESFLEKDGINFDLIRKRNLIKDGSFRQNETFGAVQSFGSVIPGIYGYIDYTCLRLRMRYLLNNKPMILTQDEMMLEKPGEYAWGTAIRTEKMSEPVTLELVAVKDGKVSYTIDSKKIPASDDWKLYKFKTTVKEKTKAQIRISSPFEWVQYPDKSFKQIFIDELFSAPVSSADYDKPHFLYLHYMAAHAPHMVQDEAKKQFYNKFSDSILPKRSIMNDRGDILHMNDHKFIVQAQHAKDWSKENDDINWHNNRYDEEILFLNEEIQKLVNILKKTGEYDDTLLIITADHGEEFLDHGFISHSQSLYNELLHIPLIMIYPNGWDGGIRIRQMTQTVDMMPTLINLINVPESLTEAADKQISGKSLLPMIMGKNHSEDRISYSSDFISKQTAAIFNGYKYIVKNSDCVKKELLFDIVKDFNEKQDLSEKDLNRLSDFRLIIQSYKDKAGKIKDITGGRSDFNSAQMQMIRGLGYITRNDVTMRGLDADCFLLWFRFMINNIGKSL